MSGKFNRLAVQETVLERQARMLSSSYNIRVVFKAGPPRTNGEVIFIPPVPDNVSPELMSAVQGYLDHEAGHIMFTNFAVFQELQDKVLFLCLNAVEDIRMERCVIDTFPGSLYNLKNAHLFVYGRARDNWDNITLFSKVLCAIGVALRYADTDFFENFIDEEVRSWAVKGLSVVDVASMRDTHDALIAAKMLYEILEPIIQDADRESDMPEDAEAMSEDAGEGETASGEQTMASVGASSEDSAFPEPLEHASTIGEELSSIFEEIQPEQQEYTHGVGSDGSYSVYSTERDLVFNASKVTARDGASYLTRLREEAQPYTRVMRTKLVNSLRALSQSRWQGGKECGKLDTRRAYLGSLGVSGAVYKTKVPGLELSTAVALAIDHSGSMSGRPLELAAEAAVVLGDVFSPLKIPFFVYGYSTSDTLCPADTKPYARWNSLWLKVYKDFAESWASGALKLTTARRSSMYNTLDGESVRFGAMHLLSRPEARKILIVINDGHPYPGSGHLGRCQAHLKNMVKSVEDAGVEVLAFGVQSHAVKEYYSNYVVINNLEDLVREPLDKIDQVLRKGIYRR
jgi:hypothetical protein